MIGKDSNLDLPDTEGEIGYWIGVPFWGQGLIPEAVEELLRHGFEDLHLEKIWCGYFEGNEKSKRVQEKCGFTYHHTNRDIYWKLMDDIRTEHITCLTRSNWLSEDSKCVVIKNRTVFSQQDWVFVGQQNRFTIGNVIFRLSFLYVGVFMMKRGGRLMLPPIYSLITKQDINFRLLFYAIFYLGIGLYTLTYAVFFNRIMARRKCKNSGMKYPREAVFLDEYVKVSNVGDGNYHEDHYPYTAMEEYIEKNNAIYVRIQDKRKKTFLIFHDDAYIEGSREDVISLLESKGVMKK